MKKLETTEKVISHLSLSQKEQGIQGWPTKENAGKETMDPKKKMVLNGKINEEVLRTVWERKQILKMGKKGVNMQ